MSQSDLARDAEISARYLGLLEAGRCRPSQELLLRLATCLKVPLRNRNALLEAGGFARMFEERAFDAPALDTVRRNIEILLASHEPNPALVVDRHWTLMTANRAIAHLVAGAEPILLRPPVNLLRLFLHPAGLAPRIVNLTQWRAHVIERLRQQIAGSRDVVLEDLLDEIRDYHGPGGTACLQQTEAGAAASVLRLATFDGVLSFFNTTTRFCGAVDVTIAELAIETLLPADAETAAAMQRVGEADAGRPGWRMDAAIALA